jgi:uncharacterized membrane protein YfcA
MLLSTILALIIGLVLGLLGGGGSILTVPVLVYLLDVPPKQAIATSLVVVGGTAAVAAIQHARGGRVQWRTGLIFSAAGMVGAAAGGFAADWFSGTVLLILFAAMMIATGVAMLVGRKEPDPDAPKKHHPAWLIAAEGLLVGGVTGLVGAGGGFLVVPALVLFGGLSMQQAVGTSLLVIALKSGAGFIGHATHVQIDWAMAAGFTAATIVGSLAGSALSAKVSGKSLRKGFAVFVLFMAGIVLWQELGAEPRAETPTQAALETP